MARKRHNRPSSSGILLFIVGFVGCLVLCGIAGYIWWKTTAPQLPWMPELVLDEPTTATTIKDTSLYHASDRFSHAVYITDNNGVLQSLSLVMVCPDTRQITVCGIPVELHLSDADSTDTLARRFRLDGEQAANDALCFALPSAPNYYTVMSYAQVEAFAETLGGTLDVSLPKDIDEAAEDASYSVHLTAGDQALSPRQITNIMRCINWQGGRRERADMHALLVQSYVKQYITNNRPLSADYKQLYAQSTSNLTEERFSALMPFWQYMAQTQVEQSPVLMPVTGVYDGSGATLRFTFTTDCYQRLAEQWRPSETIAPSSSGNE